MKKLLKLTIKSTPAEAKLDVVELGIEKETPATFKFISSCTACKFCMKESIGKITGGYNDSVTHVSRTIYCWPEDLEKTQEQLIQIVRSVRGQFDANSKKAKYLFESTFHK